jgi:hypothetical protein
MSFSRRPAAGKAGGRTTTTGRRRAAWATVAAAALLALLPAGCTSPVDLKVGDCYDGGADEGGEVSSVHTVPCGESHDNEVYALVPYTPVGGTFPGKAALETFAEKRCVELFTAFVGIPYDESRLEVGYLTPTEGGWSSGDRSVTCVVAGAPGEKLTGSMRGTRR